MAAPAIIDYPTFLANVQEQDIRALSLMASGDLIKTMDPVEADGFEAAGVRLYNAGLVTRVRRSLETLSGETWHVFDGRVDPIAMVYVANCAMERIILSRDVIAPAP